MCHRYIIKVFFLILSFYFLKQFGVNIINYNPFDLFIVYTFRLLLDFKNLTPNLSEYQYSCVPIGFTAVFCFIINYNFFLSFAIFYSRAFIEWVFNNFRDATV